MPSRAAFRRIRNQSDNPQIIAVCVKISKNGVAIRLIPLVNLSEPQAAAFKRSRFLSFNSVMLM
jgi:hypothetical protein